MLYTRLILLLFCCVGLSFFDLFATTIDDATFSAIRRLIAKQKQSCLSILNLSGNLSDKNLQEIVLVKPYKKKIELNNGDKVDVIVQGFRNSNNSSKGKKIFFKELTIQSKGFKRTYKNISRDKAYAMFKAEVASLHNDFLKAVKDSLGDEYFFLRGYNIFHSDYLLQSNLPTIYPELIKINLKISQAIINGQKITIDSSLRLQRIKILKKLLKDWEAVAIGEAKDPLLRLATLDKLSQNKEVDVPKNLKEIALKYRGYQNMLGTVLMRKLNLYHQLKILEAATLPKYDNFFMASFVKGLNSLFGVSRGVLYLRKQIDPSSKITANKAVVEKFEKNLNRIEATGNVEKIFNKELVDLFNKSKKEITELAEMYAKIKAVERELNLLDDVSANGLFSRYYQAHDAFSAENIKLSMLQDKNNLFFKMFKYIKDNKSRKKSLDDFINELKEVYSDKDTTKIIKDFYVRKNKSKDEMSQWLLKEISDNSNKIKYQNEVLSREFTKLTNVEQKLPSNSVKIEDIIKLINSDKISRSRYKSFLSCFKEVRTLASIKNVMLAKAIFNALIGAFIFFDQHSYQDINAKFPHLSQEQAKQMYVTELVAFMKDTIVTTFFVYFGSYFSLGKGALIQRYIGVQFSQLVTSLLISNLIAEIPISYTGFRWGLPGIEPEDFRKYSMLNWERLKERDPYAFVEEWEIFNNFNDYYKPAAVQVAKKSIFQTLYGLKISTHVLFASDLLLMAAYCSNKNISIFLGANLAIWGSKVGQRTYQIWSRKRDIGE